jgi:hypothetical protein
MKTVAIIGVGITGLTAAFYLQRKGIPVTVYEASPRAGGVIRSFREEGFLAESGPNTILETSPKIAQLVLDAGLEPRRLEPDPTAEARYVVRYKRPIAMPVSPLGFVTTSLFTPMAKLRVLREPFVAPRRDGADESIASFVIRRLGQEFLDHAIDAVVGGVYAGDPYQLSVDQAFPKLAALERKYGSLIKGQILGPELLRGAEHRAPYVLPGAMLCNCPRLRHRGAVAAGQVLGRFPVAAGTRPVAEALHGGGVCAPGRGWREEVAGDMPRLCVRLSRDARRDRGPRPGDFHLGRRSGVDGYPLHE